MTDARCEARTEHTVVTRHGFPEYRNPVEVLHETHIGRFKVRDRYGYEFYVDASEVEQ